MSSSNRNLNAGLHDMLRMVIVQIVFQYLISVTKGVPFLDESFVETILFLSIGVLFYWLIIHTLLDILKDRFKITNLPLPFQLSPYFLERNDREYFSMSENDDDEEYDDSNEYNDEYNNEEEIEMNSMYENGTKLSDLLN